MSKNPLSTNSADRTASTTLSTEERRTIAPDLVLEGTMIWDRYKLPIVAAVTLVVLGLVGSEFYETNRAKAASAASALLDASKTPAEYQKVIDTYPGSEAAANAYLLLGRARYDAGDHPGAVQAWQTLASKYPQHPLLPTALIGVAGALEAQGKLDEARTMYQRAASAQPHSYVAPLARLAEAELLLAQRKTAEAKHIYEDLIATGRQDIAGLAGQSLKMLNSLPPVGSTPAAAPVAAAPAVVPPVAAVVAPAAAAPSPAA